MRPQLAKQLLDLQELPTLPLVVTRIVTMTDDPRSSASDLKHLIVNDQAIAAKILKLANSAFYGLPGKITTLNRAVTLLGFNTVRSLALSISIMEVFSGHSECPYFNRSRFWEHSLAVASCAKLLAAKHRPDERDEAHMAGLFHDIGKVVLDQYFFEYFATAMEIAHKTGISSNEAEQRILGADHAEVGAQVATRWNFPSHLVEVIRHHHNPDGAPGNTICQIVALASVLCQEWGFGDSGESDSYAGIDGIRAQYCGTS
ncbi:MAG TPA: HDOD domain-containing protein, partial [bacterium]|nr:HDOD domain-containing protein [bacterium]